jgi:hypothetical protein
MAMLIVAVIALAVGFVLGRVWEIRLSMLHGAPRPPRVSTDTQAYRTSTPRDLIASQGDSSMGF